MAIQLYERVGRSFAHRPSPFSWRARMALAHKGLAVEYIPVKFIEKDVIAFSGQGLVPVLRDGERVVWDSWAIACYLEETYPARPSLFNGAAGQALAEFVNCWTDETLLPIAFHLVAADFCHGIAEEDRPYFRATRETRLGQPLESLQPLRPHYLAELDRALVPLRKVLERRPFLAGEAPAYADYIVFSIFQGARGSSPQPLLSPGDSLIGYDRRMRRLFGGLADSVELLRRELADDLPEAGQAL